MLVLARKENESLVIANRIVVTVLEIRGSQVRIGIEAPNEVGVYRSELTMSGSGGKRAASTA
jgi:carbon storage regulator